MDALSIADRKKQSNFNENRPSFELARPLQTLEVRHGRAAMCPMRGLLASLSGEHPASSNQEALGFESHFSIGWKRSETTSWGPSSLELEVPPSRERNLPSRVVLNPSTMPFAAAVASHRSANAKLSAMGVEQTSTRRTQRQPQGHSRWGNEDDGFSGGVYAASALVAF